MVSLFGCCDEDDDREEEVEEETCVVGIVGGKFDLKPLINK